MTETSRLRVALVAPPWYPTPPEGYGGIELVVHLLATELCRRGHDVTVFGREGSTGDYDVVPLADDEWAEDLGTRDQAAREYLHLLRAYNLVRRRPFDVVHDHMGLPGVLMGSAMPLDAPVVSTMHGDLTPAAEELLAAVERDVALVAISAFQRDQARRVRWAGVVHNAVDLGSLTTSTEKEGYLVNLARISADKGQHLAIRAAREAGRRLVLAGKVQEGGDDYFHREIEPHLGEAVEWIEDVGGRDKAELLARASAMIFPIQWPEPFGLAMVEAMVSGTPVIAIRNGAAPELVEEGVTGFLADEPDQLAGLVGRVDEIDPAACAERARDRFSAARMADGYEAVYRQVLAGDGRRD